ATNGGAAPAGANITFTGTLGGAQALVLTAGTAGAIVLQGAVGVPTPLASLSATGNTLSLPAIQTSGAQSYTGAATLGGSLTSAGAPILINGPATLTAGVMVDTTNAGATPTGANVTFAG